MGKKMLRLFLNFVVLCVAELPKALTPKLRVSSAASSLFIDSISNENFVDIHVGPPIIIPIKQPELAGLN